MPTVKLYYFAVKALGEGPRMLLAYGGQEFEDIRFTKDDWPNHKSNFKFGQVPVLEIDGKQYSQSMAIARFLGHKYGVAGSNPEEDFEIDETIDFFTDFRMNATKIHYEEDEERKQKLLKEVNDNILPKFCERFSEIIEKNNGHLALNKLTWGDFVFTGMLDSLKFVFQQPDLEKKYPNFQRVIDNVLSHPKVKAYVDNAPKCEY